MSQNSDIIIRAAGPDDIKFIMSSWKRSWRVSPWAGVVRNDEYYDSIRSTIDGLIARGSVLRVACLSDRPERILGWICYEVLSDGFCCVHYIYVKDPFIPLRVGAQLLDSADGTKPGLYTFRFRQVADECQGWRHAPEVARRK